LSLFITTDDGDDFGDEDNAFDGSFVEIDPNLKDFTFANNPVGDGELYDFDDGLARR
jgi:hypothetical protein